MLERIPLLAGGEEKKNKWTSVSEEQSSPAVIVSHAERCEPVVFGSGGSVKPKPCLRTVPHCGPSLSGSLSSARRFPAAAAGANANPARFHLDPHYQRERCPVHVGMCARDQQQRGGGDTSERTAG